MAYKHRFVFSHLPTDQFPTPKKLCDNTPNYCHQGRIIFQAAFLLVSLGAALTHLKVKS